MSPSAVIGASPCFFEADDYRLYRRRGRLRADPRVCGVSRLAGRRGHGEPDRAGPTIGRPLGRPEWIAMLERRLGHPLAPRDRAAVNDN
jgi:hypothetical protein